MKLNTQLLLVLLLITMVFISGCTQQTTTAPEINKEQISTKTTTTPTPANAVIINYNETTDGMEGNDIYVKIVFDISNPTSKTVTLNQGDFKLQDSEGLIKGASYTQTSNIIPINGLELASGGHVTRNLLFSKPKGSYTIIYDGTEKVILHKI